MAGGINSVIISIGAQTAQAVTEIGKVDKALGKTQTTGQKFASGLQSAALPAAAALTAISAAAISATKAAAQDAESQSKLEGQLKRSTGATDAQVASTEAWISSMSLATATSDDDLRPALSQLVGVTHDTAKAQALLTESLDLAAATGKPLATTTAAIAKASDGHAASLKKLVPSLDDAAVKAGDWNAIQKQLNAQVKGAAEGDAETAAGQYRSMTIQMGELQEAIGKALLPALSELTGIMLPLLAVAQEHSGVFLAIAGGVAALAAAVLVANAGLKVYNTWVALAGARSAIASAATTVWTAAQWLLNAALDANPIGLVVLAIAALVAGLVLAYKHSSTFRAIVSEAFQYVTKYGWLLLGPLAPFALALKLAWEHSQTFRDIVTGAFDAVLDAIHAILDALNKVKDAFSLIHKPSWLSNPLSLVPGAAATGFMGPTTLAGAIPAGSVNITIQGAIDPESTALAVRRVLERYDRRRGRRPLGT